MLDRLIRSGDVLVDNFKQGTLARWGFDDPWFEANAPAVIRCSITGYGSTGPKSEMPGYDFILQAETGLMAITGEQDGTPMKLGVAIVDLCTGMQATIAILAALEARRRNGRGQRCEVNLHDTGLHLLANVASNYLVSGDEAGRYGNGHPNIVPYRTYAASDGELALAVGNDRQFAVLAGEVGHPEWAEDPRFATNPERVRNRYLVDEMVGRVMATRSRAEWVETFDRIGVPSGPINRVSEALSSPQTLAREMVMQNEHSVAGTVSTLGLPIEMSETPSSVRLEPPMLGADTDAVLGGVGLFGRGDRRVAGRPAWSERRLEEIPWIGRRGYGFCLGGLVVSNVCSILRFCLPISTFSTRSGPTIRMGCRRIWSRFLRVCCWGDPVSVWIGIGCRGLTGCGC